MPRRRTATALILVLTGTAACASGGSPAARSGPTPFATPAATAAPQLSAAPVPAAVGRAAGSPAALPDYGGEGVRWPRRSRGRAPRPLGALLTTGRVHRADGGTLAAGLLLPLVAPGRVLTPCGAETSLRGPTRLVPPGGRGGPLVLVDPGHGGREDGARAADGTREADQVLLIGRSVAADLRAARVPAVLSRDRDMEETIGFRTALADALGVRLAVSVHLNAVPELRDSRVPGTSTYGSVADPSGRRAAGVLYASVRRYLQWLTGRVGRWAANRDSGALYRLGRRGSDYYGLLRRGRHTWVIVESLYLTAPREEALVRDPAVRAGLAAAIADGARRVVRGPDRGSGWRVPHPRPPDPPAPPLPGRCTDPS